jgi:predicted protein tyrosine phosphatase
VEQRRKQFTLNERRRFVRVVLSSLIRGRNMKILTCCSKGLCRSVGLADVLKLHFEPVDVIPIGLDSNSLETISMLYEWADYIILMEEKYGSKFSRIVGPGSKRHVYICEVGPDIYGNSHNPVLIDKCWRWVRSMVNTLGITEHFRRI